MSHTSLLESNAAVDSDRPKGLKSVIYWGLSSIPTALVVLALGAIAWWGHHSDWKLPRFFDISGATTQNDIDPRGVPESLCVVCNNSDAKNWNGFGWCPTHGVSECPWEHPEVAQLKSTPRVSEEQLATAAEALRVRPREANNSQCKTHQCLIQVPSFESLEKSGVDIDVVSEQAVHEAVVANGEVMFDQTRTAHLASRVPGTIWHVEKQIGDRVQAGDVLLLIDSLEVGQAKGEFLNALSDVRLKKGVVDRLAPLAKSGAVSGRQGLDAEAALQQAEIRLLAAQQALVNLDLPVQVERFAKSAVKDVARELRFAGISDSVLAKLDAATASSNLIPVKSPVDGVIVETDAVIGEVVAPTTGLFTVADRNRLWVTVDVPQPEAKYVKLGQKLLFQPDGADGELEGRINWIADTIDEKTRMLKVRTEVRNDSRQIKAFTFGTGRVVLREAPKAVVVPHDAVHWEGCCHIVFVRNRDFLKKDAAKFFEVRKVRLGVKTEEYTEVIAGLLPGEVVAAKGSDTLRVELLKGNLGAECGHTTD